MKFYTLSPNVPENPVLFPMMRPTIIAEGHQFVNNISECDVVMLDLHTRIADYDQRDVDWILRNRCSVATWDEFDKGGMSNLDWPEPLTKQQEAIFEHLNNPYGGYKAVHFCRLLNKTKQYPDNVYPYEKPILHEEPILSSKDLFDRKYDVVWIANTAPQRERLADSLRGDGRLKVNIVLGEKQVSFTDWVNEHKNGKMFVSCSAGGYSNQCVQALFSISVQLKEINNQLLLHPFAHGENSVMISDEPTKGQLDFLVDVVNDKNRLYQMYTTNVKHMKEFYSSEYISKFFLKKITECLYEKN